MKNYLGLAALLVLGSASVGLAADAKANWDEMCAKCHGSAGAGDTKMGKKLNLRDLTDAKVQAQFTDADAFKAMKDGLKDKEGKLKMKAMEGLSDDDIRALVAYVRGLKK
ncbi:MAG: cytochrome c [Opitutae bacterium]|nr:cytochrome c [Opitutae bacterium]